MGVAAALFESASVPPATVPTTLRTNCVPAAPRLTGCSVVDQEAIVRLMCAQAFSCMLNLRGNRMKCHLHLRCSPLLPSETLLKYSLCLAKVKLERDFFLVPARKYSFLSLHILRIFPPSRAADNPLVGPFAARTHPAEGLETGVRTPPAGTPGAGQSATVCPDSGHQGDGGGLDT